MAVIEVVKLNRKEALWICKSCKSQYKTLPSQCGKCGALPSEFDKEETFLPEDMPRKTYRVINNIVYEGAQYSGPYNLIECDNVKCGRTYRHSLPPDAELGIPKCKCGSTKFHDKPVPGAIISLPEDDRVTIDLLKRGLIKEVSKSKRDNS